MKRLGERGGGNFLLLKIIVEGGGENFLCVLRYRQQRSSFLLKLLPGPVSYTHLDVYKRQEYARISRYKLALHRVALREADSIHVTIYTPKY